MLATKTILVRTKRLSVMAAVFVNVLLHYLAWFVYSILVFDSCEM